MSLKAHSTCIGLQVDTKIAGNILVDWFLIFMPGKKFVYSINALQCLAEDRSNFS